MVKEEKSFVEGLMSKFKAGEINRRELLKLATAAGAMGTLLKYFPGWTKEASAAIKARQANGYQVDPVTEQLIDRAKELKINIIWDRFEAKEPQSHNEQDYATCINCQQGPCRKVAYGACGASIDLIISRNLLMETARGTSAHVGHARRAANTLKLVAEGAATGYTIKDGSKLDAIYQGLGLTGGGSTKKKALAVANATLEDLTKLEGVPQWLTYKANSERQAKWADLAGDGQYSILPSGACPEIAEAMHSSCMGTDRDWTNYLLRCLKLGLVDGYCGLHAASGIQDVLFGTASLVAAKSNLTVIDPDKVNLVVHGHVPILAEKIVEKAQEYNKNNSPKINVVGICCTGNEVLMRHGINIAGSLLQQELAIITGAVEVMVVDVQCIYPALADVAAKFHTKIVSTDPLAKISDDIHGTFDPTQADVQAQYLVDLAVSNYANRDPGKVFIPNISPHDIVAGFSTEMILEVLDKVKPGDPVGILVEQITNGNIRGIAAVIGCDSVRADKYGYRIVNLIKELLANNVLVVVTGCAAIVASYYDLLKADPSYPGVGSSLAAVLDVIAKANGLEAVPPCLHMGS
jgi:carbon-monoxide dehydrogenase catalytic subunit